MKKSPSSPSGRRCFKLSAVEKLKIVKLFLEDGYTLPQLAAQFQVGKSTIGTWVRLYRAHGSGTFTKPSGSAVASAAPNAAADFVNSQIVIHKQAHPDHGIKRITQIFRRFLGLEVSTHQVREVLNAQDLMNPPPPSRKGKAEPAICFFERKSPNELWHTDVMYYSFKGAKIFIMGYLDDYSRYMTGLEAFHSQTVGHTLDLLKKCCGDYKCPQEIVTDGGRQFCSWTGKSQFGTYLRKHDIKHTVCRPHHPQTNGKLERFWHTLREEFLDKARFNTFEELNEQLAQFVKYYNFQRPHQGIGGMTPADRFFEVESAVKKQLAEQIKENALELALRGQLKNPFYMVGRIGAQNVAIREEKGRICMQVDGVSCPAGNPVQFALSAQSDLEKPFHSEEINHGKNNPGTDHTTDLGTNENPVADAPDLFGREMPGGVGGVDGEGNREFDLPSVGGAAAAGGTLGGTGAGGDARSLEQAGAGADCADLGGAVESPGEVIGETPAEPDGETGGDGRKSRSVRPQNLGGEAEKGRWKLNKDCDDFSITI